MTNCRHCGDVIVEDDMGWYHSDSGGIYCQKTVAEPEEASK